MGLKFHHEFLIENKFRLLQSIGMTRHEKLRDANCMCEYENLFSAIKILLVRLLRRIIFDFQEKLEVGKIYRKFKAIILLSKFIGKSIKINEFLDYFHT